MLIKNYIFYLQIIAHNIDPFTDQLTKKDTKEVFSTKEACSTREIFSIRVIYSTRACSTKVASSTKVVSLIRVASSTKAISLIKVITIMKIMKNTNIHPITPIASPTITIHRPTITAINQYTG